MKKDITIGEFTYEFHLPELKDTDTEKENGKCRFQFENDNVAQTLADWCALINNPNPNEDKWYVLPSLPGFQFLNLKIHHIDPNGFIRGNEVKKEDIIEHTVTLVYDKVERIK